jgi:nitroreductase
VEFTEALKRRRMIRAFTTEPLPEGLTDRLLAAAARAPSAGFSQGFSFLVLEGAEQCAPFWPLIFAQAEEDADERMHRLVKGMSQAPLLIVPMASKEVYLDNYAERGWGTKAAGRCRTGTSTPVRRPANPARRRRKPLADLVHRGHW